MAGDGPSADGYTQCPGCLTVFRIDAATLAAAAGRVRCGLCGEPFAAAARYRSELAPDVPVDPPLPATGAVAPGTTKTDGMTAASPVNGPEVDATDDRPDDGLAPAPVDTTASESASVDYAPGIGADWRTATVQALEAGQGVSGRQRGVARGIAWGAGCLLLAVALVAQLAWAWRHELARNPAWRPWVVAACELAPCDLVPARVPEAVVILRRAIRPHPEAANALRLTATLVSRAEHPQPWPQLGLRLFALNGRTVAAHWFGPAAYRPVTGDDGLMQPGRRYRIAVGFIDPGTQAESFEIAFR